MNKAFKRNKLTDRLCSNSVQHWTKRGEMWWANEFNRVINKQQ